MYGVKNWTVTARTLKKDEVCADYGNYLLDERHPNHQHTEILHIYGDARKLAHQSILNATAQDQANRANKGGRPPARQVSFNFVLPSPWAIRPTLHDWQMIAKTIIRSTAKEFGLPIRELMRHTFINAHNQSNSHLNLVIANVWEREDGGLETIRVLKQRPFLAHLKKTFTDAANLQLGIDHRHYCPENRLYGRRMNQSRAKTEPVTSERTKRWAHISEFLVGQSTRLNKLTAAALAKDERQVKRQTNRIVRSFSDDLKLQAKLRRLLSSKMFLEDFERVPLPREKSCNERAGTLASTPRRRPVC